MSLSGSELYSKYWGTPTYDDQILFELLTVGTFQAGLDWRIVTNKRTVFMRNFEEFNVAKVAAMMSDDVDRIVSDPEMIRNRRKIESTIINAQRILLIQREYGSFSNFLWGFVDQKPVEHVYVHSSEVPNTLEITTQIAKVLKKKGFKFVGPVVTCMFLKASGLIKDVVLAD